MLIPKLGEVILEVGEGFVGGVLREVYRGRNRRGERAGRSAPSRPLFRDVFDIREVV